MVHIPPECLDKVLTAMKEYFALDSETKLELYRRRTPLRSCGPCTFRCKMDILTSIMIYLVSARTPSGNAIIPSTMEVREYIQSQCGSATFATL
ncbi:hypothetical protein HYDPIDRAFT_118883 [Hydnomerulius pinastri MD-312]|uniref:Uncharacterized protein n=1 Tax=Hydnomerulius pinastri MD-312 TaxID=994086 RepID=A0A0C9W7Z0_9AGAM|nr:hypothetical protein HYDPIDRAFT_118883 [Hydnomerulius pinastri MD-312]